MSHVNLRLVYSHVLAYTLGIGTAAVAIIVGANS
jgi:hypothetical protein